MKILITSFCCLFMSFLHAQKNFKKGYVITQSNDTIHGEINYTNDRILKNTCEFRSKEASINKFSAKDIKAFRFDKSKYFVSKKIKEGVVFLEYLVKGRLSVFASYNGSGNNFYIQKENQNLVLLSYEEGLKKIKGKFYFFQTNKHIEELQSLTSDSPVSLKKAEEIKKPDYSNLIKFAKRYHSSVCNEECLVFLKGEKSLKINIELFLGRHNIHVSQENNRGGFESLSDMGFFVNIRSSRNTENFFYTVGYLKDNSEHDSSRIPVYLTYIWQEKYKLTPMVSYGVSKFAPTMALGLYYGVFKKIKVGVKSIAWFKNDASTFLKKSLGTFIPISGLKGYSLLGGLMIDL